MSEPAHWIAVDWGSTRLRAWAMARDGRPMAQAAAPLGMNRLAPADYEPALLGLAAPWLAPGRRTPVVLCGMVGAAQGWAPAPYGETPAELIHLSAPILAPILAPTRAPTTDPRLDARILPGLKQTDPPDVMRGEETLLAGFAASAPDFDGMAVLPGTHSKWARLERGRLARFSTYMTGELFGLLAETSMLRHSVGGAEDGWSDEAFAEGLRSARDEPAAFSRRLFGLRAAQLLQGAPAAVSRARLSGLVIGLELADALRDAPDATPIAVIADGAIAERYAQALAQTGRAARRFGAEEAALAGLGAAYRALEERGEWA